MDLLGVCLPRHSALPQRSNSRHCDGEEILPDSSYASNRSTPCHLYQQRSDLASRDLWMKDVRISNSRYYESTLAAVSFPKSIEGKEAASQEGIRPLHLMAHGYRCQRRQNVRIPHASLNQKSGSTSVPSWYEQMTSTC